MKNKPKEFFRKFGFELEFSTPMNEAEKVIKAAILKSYGKNQFIKSGLVYGSEHKYKKWEFKYDGSTETELTTPISSYEHFKKISEVLDLLYQTDLKITEKDSVHVHMQANDVPKHNIIAAWIQIEKCIMNCFPKHRRNNNYCQKLLHWSKSKKIPEFFMKAEEESEEHHAIISLNYYNNRKTVEFRIMEGNIDKKDILNWVKFCMLFLNYAKNVDPIEIICKKTNLQLKLNQMIELLNIEDDGVIEFLERRTEQFKDTKNIRKKK